MFNSTDKESTWQDSVIAIPSCWSLDTSRHIYIRDDSGFRFIRAGQYEECPDFFADEKLLFTVETDHVTNSHTVVGKGGSSEGAAEVKLRDSCLTRLILGEAKRIFASG